ncbi:GPW/gp25 family protein [Spirosoma flavum]|uniref:GPW/gp25 family protein n=1 Tax=Spirosoma flavum TaxID=2048557 RepID=A0ABW6AHZ8_9BACT
MELPEKSFLGIGWSFPPSFDQKISSGHDGQLVSMAAAAEDIRQSLYILFHTEPGERIMVPDYGCALRQFLFETSDTTTNRHLQEVVELAILNFEPRVQVNAVSINAGNALDGVLFIEVDYTIRTINSRHNVVFPFYKTEANLL